MSYLLPRSSWPGVSALLLGLCSYLEVLRRGLYRVRYGAPGTVQDLLAALW